jgi:hemerythrin-like domain-containing protein
MQNRAESYVGELRADHARFSRVLSMLGRDARRLEDEPKTVLPLLREAVDYIVNFQNKHHHPREEVMFARITEKSASLATPAARLTKEHMALGRAGKSMLTLLKDASGAEKGNKSRQQLAHKLEKFARDMRAHINQEEQLLYSQVWTELDEQDWEQLVDADPGADPLGATDDKRYPLLTRYVLEGAPHSEVSLRSPTLAQRLESKLENGSFGSRKIHGIGSILARHRREACALSRKSISELPRHPILNPGASLRVGLRSKREFGRAYARWFREWREGLRDGSL